MTEHLQVDAVSREINVHVHTEPKDVVWYGAKVGFGLTCGAILAACLIWLGSRLLRWVVGL